MNTHDIEQHAAFENWARWFALPLGRVVSGERYESMETEAASKAWQAAIEADHKRRGEPVGTLSRSADESIKFTPFVDLHVTDGMLVYTDHQPRPTENDPSGADGYAYRYRHINGGTVLRFNHGEEVNGSKPIEAVPFWFKPQPPQIPDGLVPIFQIKLHSDTESTWHDATQSAYDVTPTKMRRTIYTSLQPAERASTILPSEAVYAFAAWLTCRKQLVTLGSTCDAAPVAELVKEFTESQEWKPPRDDYTTRLKDYPVEQPAALKGLIQRINGLQTYGVRLKPRSTSAPLTAAESHGCHGGDGATLPTAAIEAAPTNGPLKLEPLKYGGPDSDDYVTGWNDAIRALEINGRAVDGTEG